VAFLKSRRYRRRVLVRKGSKAMRIMAAYALEGSSDPLDRFRIRYEPPLPSRPHTAIPAPVS